MQEDTSPIERDPQGPADGKIALIVYVLILAGFAVGITPLIGVVMAYVYRGNGPAWLDAHYRYQIRTFWIGVLYFVLASVLSLIGVGFVLFVLLAIWVVVRCVKGFQALNEQRAPANVDSWLW